jgi:hypothetical protein
VSADLKIGKRVTRGRDSCAQRTGATLAYNHRHDGWSHRHKRSPGLVHCGQHAQVINKAPDPQNLPKDVDGGSHRRVACQTLCGELALASDCPMTVLKDSMPWFDANTPITRDNVDFYVLEFRRSARGPQCVRAVVTVMIRQQVKVRAACNVLLLARPKPCYVSW